MARGRGGFGVELCRVCKARVILASDKGDTRVVHISEDISNDTLPPVRSADAKRTAGAVSKAQRGRRRRWENGGRLFA